MSFRAFDLLLLVRDFGETLTLRQITTDGAYNPSTGSVDGASTTDTSFTGYMYDYSLMNPDEITRGSRKCLIPSLDFIPEPSPDDLILGNSDTVVITSVKTIFSNGTAVCYICHVEE